MNKLKGLGLPRSFWRLLAEVRHGDLIRRLEKLTRNYEYDAFDVAEAVYWLAADYGESEHDPLRCAATASTFEPGPMHNHPQSEAAHYLYSELATIL